MMHIILKSLVGLALLLASLVSARADSFFFDDSTVASSGQQITVTRLPVRKSNGTVIYRDVTMTFSVNPAGKVVVKSIKTVNSPAQIVGSGKLQAGKYYLANNKSFVYEVVGPQVGLNGHDLWTIRRNGLTLVRLYAGPVKGHPFETAILQSGVAADLTFGMTDGAIGTGTNESNISGGHLVGAQVRAEEITLSSFGPFTDPEPTPNQLLVLNKCKATDAC